MARPKRLPEARRDYHIGVRFSASEYEKITGESEELGVTLSSYIRSKALNGTLRIPKHAKADTNALNQLSKIGGFINKIHTESGGAYRVQTAELIEDMRRVVLEIEQSMNHVE